MAYTVQMSKQIMVPDTVFGESQKAVLNDQEIVELTAGVGAYKCVSRFLVALDVGVKTMKTTVDATGTAKRRYDAH
ncbi:hypothetical protein KEM54_000503 [Ascosphaera aggregata]|nr:hypothetical protein KEM54_000503 [Ascosphaera aggregata]